MHATTLSLSILSGASRTGSEVTTTHFRFLLWRHMTSTVLVGATRAAVTDKVQILSGFTQENLFLTRTPSLLQASWWLSLHRATCPLCLFCPHPTLGLQSPLHRSGGWPRHLSTMGKTVPLLTTHTTRSPYWLLFQLPHPLKTIDKGHGM